MEKVLLHQHLWLLGILLTSAAMGAAWIFVWQKTSTESLRINTILREAQHLYTDIYRQAQEASIASRASDNMSIGQYWDHIYNMDARFERLEQGLKVLGEPQATAGMRHAYSMMQIQINVLLTERDRKDSHLLIDKAVERWITGMFSDAYSSLTRILDSRSAKIANRLERWNHFAVWLFPSPILAAVLFVMLSLRRLERIFSQPMQTLSEGAIKMARGDLEHRIPESGVAETRSLASSINQLAADLIEAREPVLEKERQASLERLIPIVAHNIRNPLASIRAVAQAATPEDSVEEQQDTKKAIIATVDRLERWTASLLDYLNPFYPQYVTIAADTLIQDLVGLVESQATKRAINIIYQKNAALVFQADRNLLEQALHGLLINAIEASPPHSDIIIRVTYSNRETTIYIEDQGPGMPFIPDVASRGPGPSTKTHGTGIGIPFALRVCQAHGGHLGFDRSKHGGTIASMQLNTDGKSIV